MNICYILNFTINIISVKSTVWYYKRCSLLKGVKGHGSCIYTGCIVTLDMLFRIVTFGSRQKFILQYELMNMSLQLIFISLSSVCVFTIKMHNSNIYLQFGEKHFVHVLMMTWQPNFRKKKT